jgi:hypothetical protein
MVSKMSRSLGVEETDVLSPSFINPGLVFEPLLKFHRRGGEDRTLLSWLQAHRPTIFGFPPLQVG